MKKLSVLVLFILLAVPAFAQQETLVKGDVVYGGYIGPVAKYTQINDGYGVLLGGRGGLILNHAFSLGIAGYGLASNVDADAPYDNRNIMMGYYGLVPEYIFRDRKLVNISVAALIGAGGIQVQDPSTNNMDHNMDAFFVAEPELTLYLNVVRHFRVGLGAGYRFTGGVDRKGLSDSEIGGFTANLTLQFGVF